MPHRLVAASVAFSAAFFAASDAARAHPHVFVDSRSTVVVEDGKITAIRHEWRFDEIFSAFFIQDFDTDADGAFSAEEIAQLEINAFSNLKDFGYFTRVMVGDDVIPLVDYESFSARIDDGAIYYDFTVLLTEPVAADGDSLAIGVYDESYYVDMAYEKTDPIRFSGDDNGCAYEMKKDPANPIYFGMVVPTVAVVTCNPTS